MLQQKPANVDRKNIWKLYLEMYLKKNFLIHTLISVYMYRQKKYKIHKHTLYRNWYNEKFYSKII